ncbi:uncharacterized protein LOC111324685 isoform X2 [Stylophora pistillata]|uniref:uncharacterized protein LOC111324685 isoform X2 n=1 Tax=Stylophora pistillata TaxID=50429 RepID=UPI000C03CD81|nr:uncharacterized protein LOC111324685 isoform X2 [Stylophora pistillata]
MKSMLYVAILAVLHISTQVFAADPSGLYCFSCHGYDEDGRTKCKGRETGELFVRKCTTNSSLLPACLEYTAFYKIPQMMGNQLKMVESAVHGLHCGTLAMCARSECPNFWPKDLSTDKCKVKCCTAKDKSCSFPTPTPVEIDRYEQREAMKGNVDALGVQSGKRSGGVNRISESVWIQGVVLAFCCLG